MSATQRNLDDWEPEWVNAREALHNVEEGDKILFADRKQPLTVQDVGGTSENEDHYIVAVGPRGGEAVINEHYNPNGTPDYRTESGERATNLRIVEKAGDDSPEETGSGGVYPGDDGSNSGSQDGDSREMPGVGHSWPEPPASADSQPADDYVSNLIGDPLADYEDLLEGTIEEPDTIIDSFMEEESPTWTFVDELLAFGEDVPKTVNNWHLIDYGIVTDQTVDDTRKMAWWNFETDELLAIIVVNDGDGPIWNVYHATDQSDISEEERQPELETREFSEALELVEDYLYGDPEQVDISVEESANGRMTIQDAISNTHLAERLSQAGEADPFGIRSYVRNTTPGQFVLDVDEAIFDTIGRAREAADEGWQRVTSRIRQLWHDYKSELGKVAKWALIQSVSALSKRFLGVRITPVIRYQELGVLVEYKYTGKSQDDINAGFQMEFALNPWETFNLYEDGREDIGSRYIDFVESHDAANLREWQFDVSAPTISPGDEDSSSSSSGSRSVSVGGGPKTSTLSEDEFKKALVDESSPNAEGAATYIDPDNLAEPDRVKAILDKLDEEAEQRYILLLAMIVHAAHHFDDSDREVDEMADDALRGFVGEDRAAYSEVASEYGFQAKDSDYFPLEALIEAMKLHQVEGKSFVDAADAVSKRYTERDAVAISSEIDEFVFDMGGDEPEPVADESTSTSDEGDTDGSDDGGSPMDDMRNSEVNELVRKLEQDIISVDDLTPDQREIVRDIEEEHDILDEEDRELLDSLQSTSAVEDERDSGQRGASNSPIDAPTDTGNETLDEIAQMTEEEKDEARYRMWQESEDMGYGDRDDEFDQL